MTAASLLQPLCFREFLSTGQPAAFGTVTSYAAGTSTPIATYTDSTAGTPNSNPVVLDARGEAQIWTLPNIAYKFVVQDSAGNTIRTVDQVQQSQLLTLYGGVDTGAPNSYILTFTASFSAYANGILIYWIPANNNTGASTLNVNGLGAVAITNLDGSALGANQIVAGVTTAVMYYGSGFQLLTTGALTGSIIGTFGQEVPLSSASTVDLGTAPAHVAQITGTTTITSFGSSASILAPIYAIRFAASLTLTYNSVSMILPGGASIVTSTGDTALVQYLGSGNWKVINYQSTGGQQNSKIKPSDTTIISNATLTPDPDLQTNTLGIGRYSYELYLEFDSVAGGAGFKFTNDGTLVDSRATSPAIAYGYVNSAAYGPKNDTFYSTTVSYATVGTVANSNQVVYKGSLLVSTPGTFGISWAQASSTASATTLRAGSYLVTTLLNTGSASNTITRVYQTPGTGLETIPNGYTTLTIEVWGGPAGGGDGNGSFGGGGGASGAYARSTYSVTGLGGDTINFTVGTGGVADTAGTQSTVTSGTLAVTTMTCLPGLPGQAAGGSSAGNGGLGQAATGGNVVNQTGNNGGGGGIGGPGGLSGFGIAGIYDGGFAGGRGGSPASNPGHAAVGGGIVVFSYQ